ncbi:MAG: EamA family transporter [Bdellovibrionales bacterium]|nr:EamA family transporter [Bdellovibrionales bacterium]
MKLKPFVPGIAVVLGSLLFATDAVFRERALRVLDARAVGFLEHGIAFLSLLPWVFTKRRVEVGQPLRARSGKVSRTDIFLFLAIGLGGSALGNTFFTVAVGKIGGAGATLFTMLQPAFVLVFAWFFLKERFSSFFGPCAVWVVLNMILLSYSQTARSELPMMDENPEALSGTLYACLATLIWGGSTVAGKALLNRYPNSVVLIWRWAIAFVFLGAVVFVKDVPLPWHRIFTAEVFLPLLYLGVVAQTVAYWIYYVGLRQLPASLTTFIELLYPLVGMFLALGDTGQGVTPLQVFAALTLLIAISLLLGVEYPRAVGLGKKSAHAPERF